MIRKKKMFYKERYEEEFVDIGNPGRGWYCIHSFEAGEPIQEDLKWCVRREHQLALVIIDIGEYRKKDIDQWAIKNIHDILRFFAEEKQEVILRIVYDREGKGAEREPDFLDEVQKHMRQLGSVIKENADSIFCLQGLFIGNWGEMHGSKFLTKRYLKTLIYTLWEVIEGSCYLAVRCPKQWRMIFEKEVFAETRKNSLAWNVGLFDDGMFASWTHLGTFSDIEKDVVGWEEIWSRKAELEFEHELCTCVPNGGEAVRGNMELYPEDIISTLRTMHVSYLNSVYDEKILEEWKKTQYQILDSKKKISLYDYIGLYMGYRFVVKNVIFSGKGGMEVSVEIENVGFANFYWDAEVFIHLKGETGKEYKLLFTESPKTWVCGKKIVMSIELPDLDEKKCKLYLGIKRKKDGRYIRFANRGADELFYLGYLVNK